MILSIWNHLINKIQIPSKKETSVENRSSVYFLLLLILSIKWNTFRKTRSKSLTIIRFSCSKREEVNEIIRTHMKTKRRDTKKWRKMWNENVNMKSETRDKNKTRERPSRSGRRLPRQRCSVESELGTLEGRNSLRKRKADYDSAVPQSAP